MRRSLAADGDDWAIRPSLFRLRLEYDDDVASLVGYLEGDTNLSRGVKVLLYLEEGEYGPRLGG